MALRDATQDEGGSPEQGRLFHSPGDEYEGHPIQGRTTVMPQFKIQSGRYLPIGTEVLMQVRATVSYHQPRGIFKDDDIDHVEMTQVLKLESVEVLSPITDDEDEEAWSADGDDESDGDDDES